VQRGETVRVYGPDERCEGMLFVDAISERQVKAGLARPVRAGRPTRARQSGKAPYSSAAISW
jgi:hypothetical protein